MTTTTNTKEAFVGQLSMGPDRAGALYDQLKTISNENPTAQHAIDSVVAGKVEIVAGGKDVVRLGTAGTPQVMVYYPDPKQAGSVADRLLELYERTGLDRQPIDPRARKASVVPCELVIA